MKGRRNGRELAMKEGWELFSDEERWGKVVMEGGKVVVMEGWRQEGGNGMD